MQERDEIERQLQAEQDEIALWEAKLRGERERIVTEACGKRTLVHVFLDRDHATVGHFFDDATEIPPTWHVRCFYNQSSTKRKDNRIPHVRFEPVATLMPGRRKKGQAGRSFTWLDMHYYAGLVACELPKDEAAALDKYRQVIIISDDTDRFVQVEHWLRNRQIQCLIWNGTEKNYTQLLEHMGVSAPTKYVARRYGRPYY